MRGSDPDAALHYLGRLLEAGDLPSACRRLMVCACEDVGLAWPQIIPIVKAAVDIANAVGLPEARLPLADAVVLVATAPKSNSAHNGIIAAMEDIQAGRTGPIPRQLQNKHYDGADAKVKGQHYLYPHDFPNHWTAQQYPVSYTHLGGRSHRRSQYPEADARARGGAAYRRDDAGGIPQDNSKRFRIGTPFRQGHG